MTNLQAEKFLDAMVLPADLSDRHTSTALALCRKFPSASANSIYSAAATGRPVALRAWLKRDRKRATTRGGPRQWMPLSYLCFSRILLGTRSRSRRHDFTTCAKMLLKAGADPNTSFINPSDNVPESALYGASGTANDPALTKVLLQAGADVNDNETLYHTAEFKDHRCLRLILAKKPDLLSFCMCHKMDQEDAKGVKVFLEFGADPNFLIAQGAYDIRGLRPLHFAILRGRSAQVLQALIDGGADPALPSADGTTPFVMASRFGRHDLAKLLQRHGAAGQLSPRDEFFAACAAGQARRARALLRAAPDLLTDLPRNDASLLPRAASNGQLKVVKLMVQLGFPLEATGAWGGTALHEAAWNGQVAVVRYLLAQGSRLDTRQHFGGDVMQTAIHGAVHAGHKHGMQIVKLLAKRLPKAPWATYLADAQKARHPQLESFFRSKIKST